MLRRQEQNAADPAAVAAARFIGDPDPISGVQAYDPVEGWAAACAYARANGFFSTGNTACDAGLESDGTSMDVNYPPDASAGDFVGQPGMVQVIISAQHDTFFGRIFGQSRATVVTGAVASRQRGNANSSSLIALKPESCATARIHGNGTIKIYPTPGYTGPGGFVQINSDCGNSTADDNCATSSQGALDVAGAAHLSAPQVNVHGGCKGPSGQPVCPSPPGICNTAGGPLDEAQHQVGDPLGGLRFPPWDTSFPGAKCGITAREHDFRRVAGLRAGAAASRGLASACVTCPGLSPGGFTCVELDPGIYYGGWTSEPKLS